MSTNNVVEFKRPPKKASDMLKEKKLRKAARNLNRTMANRSHDWSEISSIVKSCNDMAERVTPLLRNMLTIAAVLEDQELFDSIRSTAGRAAIAVNDFDLFQKKYSKYKGPVTEGMYATFSDAMTTIMGQHMLAVEKLFDEVSTMSDKVTALYSAHLEAKKEAAENA